MGVTELTVWNSHPPPGHLPLACLCLVFAKGTDVLRVWKCLWENHVPCQKPPAPAMPNSQPQGLSEDLSCCVQFHQHREDVFHILGVLGRWRGWRLGPRPASLQLK